MKEIIIATIPLISLILSGFIAYLTAKSTSRHEVEKMSEHIFLAKKME